MVLERQAKFIWRLIQSFRLKRKGVIVSPYALFNNNTQFEGHNKVSKYVAISDSLIGRNTYIRENSKLLNCKIGRFCSIASDVKVVSLSHPSSVLVSTSPSFFSTLLQNGQSFVNLNVINEHLTIDGYDAIIGNDVWIGSNVIIKGGLTIGDGAILAMGAVITKDVPPYAIVGGVPAKIIRYRFDPEQIKKLLQLKWWNNDDVWFEANAGLFLNIDKYLKNNDENSNNSSSL